MMIWRNVLGVVLALAVVGSVTSCAGDNREFIQAAAKGDTAAVTTLLAQGANVNARDRYGGTALMAASDMGHPEVIQVLLAQGADVNIKGDGGITALKLAKGESEDRHEIVRLLKAAGAKE